MKCVADLSSDLCNHHISTGTVTWYYINPCYCPLFSTITSTLWSYCLNQPVALVPQEASSPGRSATPIGDSSAFSHPTSPTCTERFSPSPC